MLYLDTAALVKLVRREPESDALADWLNSSTGSTLVSSALVEVELPRALHRIEPELVSHAPTILERVSRYEIDDLVRRTAGSYTNPELRSLDAIHLATAHAVFGGRLSSFVTYDKRLRDAAQTFGLTTESPGTE